MSFISLALLDLDGGADERACFALILVRGVGGGGVVAGHSLDCTSVFQMFVSCLYVISGGWL